MSVPPAVGEEAVLAHLRRLFRRTRRYHDIQGGFSTLVAVGLGPVGPPRRRCRAGSVGSLPTGFVTDGVGGQRAGPGGLAKRRNDRRIQQSWACWNKMREISGDKMHQPL